MTPTQKHRLKQARMISPLSSDLKHRQQNLLVSHKHYKAMIASSPKEPSSNPQGLTHPHFIETIHAQASVVHLLDSFSAEQPMLSHAADMTDADASFPIPIYAK
jgi:hypothetical protein